MQPTLVSLMGRGRATILRDEYIQYKISARKAKETCEQESLLVEQRWEGVSPHSWPQR